MITVRSIKELITACRWLLNFKNAFLASDLQLISKWIEQCSSANGTEEQLKLELYELLIALKNIAWKDGFIDRNTGEIIDSIYNDTAPIIFKDKNFWFTGKAFYGARKKCEEAVLARGGRVLENRKPDYLVVGLFTETLFREDGYTNKVESALRLKADRFVESYGIHISADETISDETKFIKGYPVSIISEEHWIKHL